MQNNLSFMDLKRKMCAIGANFESIYCQPTITFTRPGTLSPLENTYESFNEYTTENHSSHFLTSLNENSNLNPFGNHYDSGYIQNSSLISSPYLTSVQNTLQHRALNNVKKSIQYQSTPNKAFFNSDHGIEKKPTIEKQTNNKVNFHSITDLATSAISDDSKSESKLSTNLSQNSINSSLNNLNQSNDLLNFNEKLKLMSQMICNKENSNELISRTKRKPRTQISKQQKEILEYAFKMKSYPDSNEIEYLCNLLGFEENVIRIWFQNKRARNKSKN
ncbi:Homeobox ANF [Brachionus plicatilis]|uniref:Homeobox ANF n=1 Tax=Brachionus plicatilis TaxID=10195 RepID=A0A3M7P2X9_BRAPC|nr:Homeobox ANF [Brachionus plicatilis]